jgi:hypothetical protein
MVVVTLTIVPEKVSPLLLALVAGGFTMLGVMLKIGYDSLAAYRASKSEALSRFASERGAYERFFAAVQRQRDYYGSLKEIADAHRLGVEIPQERLASFPNSSMREVVKGLEEVRRLARTYGEHTMVTLLLELGVPPHVVQAIARHAHVDITLKIYTHQPRRHAGGGKAP